MSRNFCWQPPLVPRKKKKKRTKKSTEKVILVLKQAEGQRKDSSLRDFQLSSYSVSSLSPVWRWNGWSWTGQGWGCPTPPFLWLLNVVLGTNTSDWRCLMCPDLIWSCSEPDQNFTIRFVSVVFSLGAECPSLERWNSWLEGVRRAHLSWGNALLLLHWILWPLPWGPLEWVAWGATVEKNVSE